MKQETQRKKEAKKKTKLAAPLTRLQAAASAKEYIASLRSTQASAKQKGK
jgi:hypothetical protein